MKHISEVNVVYLLESFINDSFINFNSLFYVSVNFDL